MNAKECADRAVLPGTPPRVATAITQISHATFASGMHAAFLVAAAVALAGAVIALATRRGSAGRG